MRILSLTTPVATVGALIALACSVRPANDGHNAPRSTVDEARSDSVVADMLAAQVSGPGGCLALDQVDTLNAPFFPGVRLLRARCTPEHGGSAVAFAGVDTSQVLYLLGTDAGFAFLLRRHPPAVSPFDDPLSYAALALQLSGRVQGNYRVLLDTAATSLSERDLLRNANSSGSSRVLARRPAAVIVEALLLSSNAVVSLTVSVSESGAIMPLQRSEWRQP